jgi:hypothetical protein
MAAAYRGDISEEMAPKSRVNPDHHPLLSIFLQKLADFVHDLFPLRSFEREGRVSSEQKEGLPWKMIVIVSKQH